MALSAVRGWNWTTATSERWCRLLALGALNRWRAVTMSLKVLVGEAGAAEIGGGPDRGWAMALVETCPRAVLPADREVRSLAATAVVDQRRALAVTTLAEMIASLERRSQIR